MFVSLLLLSLLPLFLTLIFPIRSIQTIKNANARVVICVAARNEEGNIAACLDSLLGLNYPKELFQIRVANDGSTDRTNEILKEYELAYEQVFIHQVDRTEKHTKGKSRALAQLTKDLVCDYIAFTDADVRVSENWLMNMLSAIGTKGLVSGTTLIRGKNLFEKWQAMDWLLGQLQIQLSSRFLKGTPTAMGNNMLVQAKSYFAIGGYDELPFSVTEDVSLQQVFEKNGYATAMLFGQEYLALTQSESTWGDLSCQRQRWGKAVFDLPVLLVFFLTLQGVFLPLVMMGAFCVDVSIVLFIPIKMLLVVFVLRAKDPIKTHWSLFELLTFEWYQFRLMLGMLTKVIFFKKVKWKGQQL